MSQTSPLFSVKTTGIGWAARIIGTLFVAIFLFFFVADCMKKGTIAVDGNRIVMTIFLFVTFVGLIIAWRWEGPGGIVALCGLIGFNIFSPGTVRDLGNLLMTGMYGLPALFFVYSSWRARKHVDTKIA